MGVIYLLTSKTSGKSYVGQTIHTARYRWSQHVWEANNPGARQSRKLNNAILKYTPDDFDVEILWEGPNAQLDEQEVFFIDHYCTFEDGYNLTRGGKEKQEISDETRKKISEATRGKPKDMTNNRVREEDKVYPKYLRHYVDAKCEGFKIADHPGLNGGSVSFTRSDESMEEKFQQAMEVLDALNKGTYVLEKKKEPKGVQPIPNGYRVRIEGYPVRTFQKQKHTMEQKLKMASDYAKSIYDGMQFND